MKILQLCKKFPYPLKDGESIAVTYLSKALNTLGCTIDLLAMNTIKHHFNLQDLPTDYNHYHQIHTVDLDNRVKPIAAFLNLFSTESYHITRFITPDFSEKLQQLLQNNKYDIVLIESPFLAPYIPIVKAAKNLKIVMRTHNVEFEIWERITKNTTNPIKKWYLNLLTQRLRDYEIAQLQHYDLLAAMTHRDAQKFTDLGYQQRRVIIPIGLDTTQYLPNYKSFEGKLSLGFIGSLDWMPNLEGIQWFLDNVMPILVQNFPTIQLHIAGRNAPDWLVQKKIKNVVVHGEVASATDFINQHSIMIVPLFSGSGMRVKILEGMALGKVIITTTIGVEGINAIHKKHIFVADNEKDFIEAIRIAQQQGTTLQQMGEIARSFVEEHYDNLNLGKRFLKELKTIND